MKNLTTSATGMLINGVTYAFNSIYIMQSGDNIALYHQYTMRLIVAEQKYDQYQNSGTAFTSVALLLAYLNTNAFK